MVMHNGAGIHVRSVGAARRAVDDPMVDGILRFAVGQNEAIMAVAEWSMCGCGVRRQYGNDHANFHGYNSIDGWGRG